MWTAFSFGVIPNTASEKLDLANMLTVHIDYVKLCHCSFPPYAFTLLARVTIVPLEPGTAPLDSDQIVLGVNLDNGQVLHGDAHKAHVAGQALAGEHASRGRSGTVRTCMTSNRAGAVALTQTVLAKALDNALVALALGNACNVNLVALLQRRQPSGCRQRS